MSRRCHSCADGARLTGHTKARPMSSRWCSRRGAQLATVSTVLLGMPALSAASSGSFSIDATGNFVLPDNSEAENVDNSFVGADGNNFVIGTTNENNTFQAQQSYVLGSRNRNNLFEESAYRSSISGFSNDNNVIMLSDNMIQGEDNDGNIIDAFDVLISGEDNDDNFIDSTDSRYAMPLGYHVSGEGSVHLAPTA